jgi:outer membrane cobalamin receptor
MKTFVLSFLLLVSVNISFSSPEINTVIKGQVRDAATGEDLIGATVFIKELGAGTITNVYGFYSINLPAGKYVVKYSFVGYEPKFVEVELSVSKVLNVELESAFRQLGEIVVTGEKPDENVTQVRMSSNNLSMETVKALPAFMGEVDVMKSLLLLPGISSGGEGSTGIYVRGGNVDQNLVLLDEATVYNASHLMGFFSVFNADAIKDVQVYKGGMPAQYGGRLSSVVDMRMKDGNSKNFTAAGGIGSISSRLTVEGPLQKNVSSFILSGRRTYADLFLPLLSDTTLRNNQLYFYDVNTKANYRFSDRDRIFFSGYFGRDYLRVNDEFNMGWGNETATFRWNHIFNSRLFSNFTLIYSQFDYLLGFNYGVNSFDWSSAINNYSVKADFTWYLNPENTFKFGGQSHYHQFRPGKIRGTGDNSAISDFNLPVNTGLEQALYASNEQKIGSNLTMEYGIRYSLFQNLGKSTVYDLDDNYQVVDTLTYKRGEIYHSQHGFEPRLGLVYTFSGEQSLKASYNRTRQYLQQTSITSGGTPMDIWFPASPNVDAQIADQWAVGYFRNFLNHVLESSVEVYYKDMRNQLDFKDRANILLNPLMEAELRTGKAWSYGVEFMLNKTRGDFTGWFSYTWSRAWQQIDEINLGRKYPAVFDRPHDISFVLAYDFTPRLNVSANWVYQSGKPVTLPVGRYEWGGVIIPMYSDRNGSRFPDYHRLDLSATWKTRKRPNRNWEGSWNLSVYNAYYRKNVFSYSFRQNEENVHQTDAYKLYLFGIIPSVTYNFKF